MQPTTKYTNSESLISDLSKNLCAIGQFGDGPKWGFQPPRREMDRLGPSIAERITVRLVDLFNAGVYPFPHQFSDNEITVIGQWAGLDDKGTFGYHDGETPDPLYRSSDDRLIDAYKLDLSAGENTWPKFAAILKSRKDEWENSHAEERAQRNRKNQIARINRQLAKQEEKLCTSSKRAQHNLGDYYIIDIYQNAVIYLDVDPDALEADLRKTA
jgi:hypothetical protein